jgi:arylformamidase
MQKQNGGSFLLGTDEHGLFAGRKIYDISPTVHSGLAVFPGDTPFSAHFNMSLQKGDNLTLSEIRTTTHIGAHTDAPSHYASEGSGMHTRSLNYYLGSAQVVSCLGAPGRRLQIEDLKGLEIQAPRVLFRTLSYPDPDQWTTDFAALSAPLVSHLAEQGVCLIGIDTPSIDPATDKNLESHKAIAHHNMAILEGVVLHDIADGIYDLIALPLPIRDGDASPVRAVLIK